MKVNFDQTQFIVSEFSFAGVSVTLLARADQTLFQVLTRKADDPLFRCRMQTNDSTSAHRDYSARVNDLLEDPEYGYTKEYLEQKAPVFQGENADLEGLLSRPLVDVLLLSTRSYSCLRAEGIETVRQLLLWSRQELLKTPNLGTKSIKEIEEALKAKGLSLKR